MTLEILQDVNLQAFCTMATPAIAKHYCAVKTKADITSAIEFSLLQQLPLLVLGGGSNVIIRGDFEGLVIHVQLQGIDAQSLGDTVLVTASAGEVWQALVDFSLERGLWGLENLNLIPGTVGAAPIQNIGAYGVELDQIFHQLSAIRIADGELVSFQAQDCQFSYRNSWFKSVLGQYIIVDVTFKLSTVPAPKLEYPGLQNALAGLQAHALTSRQIAEAVATLRREKLPDPTLIPNTGSFFHNPIVTAEKEASLRSAFPNLVAYLQPNGGYKLAAAWLIDQAGLKGILKDGVGVHAHQALVVINPGRCSGQQVLDFAAEIQAQVQYKFGVRLVVEPQIYP